MIIVCCFAQGNFLPQDRLQVLPGDIQDHGEVVRVADIICLNNVFEFFMPPNVQARIWAFLRANIKKGALLVTIPSLEDSLQYIDVSSLNAVDRYCAAVNIQFVM